MRNDIKFRATVVSDIHIDIKNPGLRLIKYIFVRSLKLTEKDNIDAYITVGDNTSRGTEINWKITRDCFKKANIRTPIIMTVGNHDCWADKCKDEGEAEYNAAMEEYFSSAEEIMGTKLDKIYFSRTINGYKTISLGNESDAGCEANISDEQIEWLKKELSDGTKDGKPVFVFCHQSLNGRHGLPRTWDKIEKPDRTPDEGGVGEKSDEIAEILKSFKNVFYFSGHSHMGLCGEYMQKKEGYSSLYEEDGLHLINLPSLNCGNHHGEINSIGYGAEIQVFEDTVRIVPRNYVTGKYIKKINIKDGKPYYEVKIK